MMEKSLYIELETVSDYRMLAIASMAGIPNSDVQKAYTEGKVNTLLQIPQNITEDTAIENYFENLGATYFMERFLETALMNQGMPGQVMRTQDDITALRCGSWSCPVEFIYEEDERARREEYWKSQEELQNPDSDRILLYVNKNHIEDTIIPLIDTTMSGFNTAKEDFNTFIRRTILALMLDGILHGNGIQFNAASNKNSNSHKILKKYKDTADKRREKEAKKESRGIKKSPRRK